MATTEQMNQPAGSNAPAAPEQATAESALRVVQNAKVGFAIRDVRAAADTLAQEARQLGGYVSRANISRQDDQDVASAAYRVPASRLEEFLNSIKRMPGARIDGDDLTTKEVSGEYTDLESRLRNAERTEVQLQQFLVQAKTTDESLNVYTKLQAVRADIEGLKGRINLFDSQIAMATIEVSISTLVAAPAPPRGGPLGVVEDGWQASMAFAAVLVNLAVIAVFVLAWLVPIGIVAVVGTRLYRKVAPVVARLFAV